MHMHCYAVKISKMDAYNDSTIVHARAVLAALRREWREGSRHMSERLTRPPVKELRLRRELEKEERPVPRAAAAAAAGLVAAAVLPPSSSSRISPTAFFSSRVRARPTYSPRCRQLRTWRYPHFPVSAAIALTRRRREALPMLATLDMSKLSASPHGTQSSSSSVSEVRPSSMIRPFVWVNQQSLRVHLRPNLHVVTVRRRPPDGLLCPAPFRPSALVVRDHRRSGAFILRADARSETEPRRAPSEGRPDGEMLVRAPSASASSASSGAMAPGRESIEPRREEPRCQVPASASSAAAAALSSSCPGTMRTLVANGFGGLYLWFHSASKITRWPCLTVLPAAFEASSLTRLVEWKR